MHSAARVPPPKLNGQNCKKSTPYILQHGDVIDINGATFSVSFAAPSSTSKHSCHQQHCAVSASCVPQGKDVNNVQSAHRTAGGLKHKKASSCPVSSPASGAQPLHLKCRASAIPLTRVVISLPPKSSIHQSRGKQDSASNIHSSSHATAGPSTSTHMVQGTSQTAARASLLSALPQHNGSTTSSAVPAVKTSRLSIKLAMNRPTVAIRPPQPLARRVPTNPLHIPVPAALPCGKSLTLEASPSRPLQTTDLRPHDGHNRQQRSSDDCAAEHQQPGSILQQALQAGRIQPVQQAEAVLELQPVEQVVAPHSPNQCHQNPNALARGTGSGSGLWKIKSMLTAVAASGTTMDSHHAQHVEDGVSAPKHSPVRVKLPSRMGVKAAAPLCKSTLDTTVTLQVASVTTDTTLAGALPALAVPAAAVPVAATVSAVAPAAPVPAAGAAVPKPTPPAAAAAATANVGIVCVHVEVLQAGSGSNDSATQAILSDSSLLDGHAADAALHKQVAGETSDKTSDGGAVSNQNVNVHEQQQQQEEEHQEQEVQQQQQEQEDQQQQLQQHEEGHHQQQDVDEQTDNKDEDDDIIMMWEPTPCTALQPQYDAIVIDLTGAHLY